MADDIKYGDYFLAHGITGMRAGKDMNKFKRLDDGPLVPHEIRPGIFLSHCPTTEAELVSKGVQDFAVVGVASFSDSVTYGFLNDLLNKEDFDPPVEPFIVEFDDDIHFGYSRSEVLVDLYRWIHTADIPQSRKLQLLELIWGYSVCDNSLADGKSR